MKAKDLLGSRGEDLAAEYLVGAGLRIVERNWRCPSGEIDVVALDGPTLVIAEVKTRSSLAFGHPFEAIGEAKLRRLQLLGAEYAREHGCRDLARRVDAVSVLDDGTGAPVIEHLKGVGE